VELRPEEAKRWGTFFKLDACVWPHSSPALVDIVRAGFRYAPRPEKNDRVRCDACGCNLSSWNAGDDPQRSHRKFGASCSFFAAEEDGNPIAAAERVDGDDDDDDDTDGDGDDGAPVDAPAATDDVAEIYRGATQQGFLFTESRGILRELKKRWFVISGSWLYSFKTRHDQKPARAVPLTGCKVQIGGVVDDRGGKHFFELFTEDDQAVELFADTRAMMMEWTEAFEELALSSAGASAADEEFERENEGSGGGAEESADAQAFFVPGSSSSNSNSNSNSNSTREDAADLPKKSPRDRKVPGLGGGGSSRVGSRVSSTNRGEVMREGYIFKKGGFRAKEWQKRFFVLRDTTLFWYEKESDKFGTPAGSLSALMCKVETNTASNPDDVKKSRFSFDIITPQKSFSLHSATAPERDSWTLALQKCATKHVTDGEASVLAPYQRAERPAERTLLDEGRTNTPSPRTPKEQRRWELEEAMKSRPELFTFILFTPRYQTSFRKNAVAFVEKGAPSLPVIVNHWAGVKARIDELESRLAAEMGDVIELFSDDKAFEAFNKQSVAFLDQPPRAGAPDAEQGAAQLVAQFRSGAKARRR
jgi:PH domain/Inhibitor of Apoptosis domain